MNYRWKLRKADPDKVMALYTELKIHPALCRLLVVRGIETYTQAQKFFRPTLDDLHDPFLMRDMDKAIARIEQAIAQGEKILVYGDYDVDGTTAVATVYSFFQSFYPNLDYYIPNRYTEGYGISTAGIDFAEENNFSLIIALDCGIKSIDKIAYANEKNIDFIICDHHTVGDAIPNAVAVLDPKRNDCNYPYKELSGCGIGFKLIQAYSQKNNLPTESYTQYLDLLCVSIGSDIVPMDGENRILAFHGLHKLNTNPVRGLRQLKEIAGVQKTMSIDDVVFTIGPRINAAGRMGDAKHAVKLLISDEINLEAEEQAYQLNSMNNDRKDLDRSITAHALDMIANSEALLQKKSTVLFHPDWNKGVVGIVASRLTETYYRPTIIMTENDGKLTGSARSIKGFDLYDAIDACSEHLIQFGGHKFAAGLTMHLENFEAFSQKFEEVVCANVTDDMLVRELEIDAEINFSDITPKFYNILKQMAPFGPNNMKPVLMTKDVSDTGWSKIVKEDHLKFSVKHNEVQLSGIGFNLAEKMNVVKSDTFKIAYYIEENEWNDNVSLQLMVKDIEAK